MTADDPDLLRSFVNAQSQEAFAGLVQRHADLVYSAALRQVGGDAHLARDVTQSVFLTLAQKAPGLLDRTSLTGWLYTSARNFAIRAVRDHQRWRKREQEANAMREPSHVGETPEWSRVEPMLDEAMHELTEVDREIVLMRFFENRPFAEIGSRYGLEENTARMRVDRALDKLRALLARRGITSTAAALGVALSTQTVSAAPAGLATALAGSSLSNAVSSQGAPLLLTLMNASKLQLGILCVSVLLNLALLNAASRPASQPEDDPTATPRLTGSAMFVPPATPLIGDFNDPKFLARKLYLEGYSDKAIRKAVHQSVLDLRTAELDAIERKYGMAPEQPEQQNRWQPNRSQQKTPEDKVARETIFSAVESETNRIVDAVLNRVGHP